MGTALRSSVAVVALIGAVALGAAPASADHDPFGQYVTSFTVADRARATVGGDVVLSGSYSCTDEVFSVLVIDAYAAQEDGAGDFVRGTGRTQGVCDGEVHRYRVTVTPEGEGRYSARTVLYDEVNLSLCTDAGACGSVFGDRGGVREVVGLRR